MSFIDKEKDRQLQIEEAMGQLKDANKMTSEELRKLADFKDQMASSSKIDNRLQILSRLDDLKASIGELYTVLSKVL